MKNNHTFAPLAGTPVLALPEKHNTKRIKHFPLKKERNFWIGKCRFLKNDAINIYFYVS